MDRYPVAEWSVVEHGLDEDLAGRMETIFALGNGYLGIRGTPEEGAPVHEPGTFINGFYESWQILYPEAAYGFASSGQTIVNVPDATRVGVAIDGIDVAARARLIRSERTLDMRRGTLDRMATWRLDDDTQVRIESRRLVSLAHRNLAAVSWQVTCDGPATVRVTSDLTNRRDDPPGEADEYDPRRARHFDRRVLLPRLQRHADTRVVLGYRTRNSDLALACGIDHIVECDSPVEIAATATEDSGRVTFAFTADPGATFRLAKLISYHTDGVAGTADLADRVDGTLDRAADLGFEGIAAEQESAMATAWAHSDVRIGGQPELQQAVRWNLFQVIQATACLEASGVPAKGLTSQGYDGHYFWDMDMFLMPFLVYSNPAAARELLSFRFRTLDAARFRAREMSQVGALFPWRTITGEEASAYFPGGTAQYHINAAVAYAVKKYVDITGDEAFLVDMGAELVLATARLWYDLGFYGSDGSFHLHGVTGPDEYTALVNDNTYTNLMAQLHLRYAADVVDWLAAHHPDRFVQLAETVDLAGDEVEGWRHAADHMTVLYDEDRGINPQDGEFLDLEVWDFANTPAESYPLLLHHHPLVLYRHQVLKQSDVVLAMVLRGDLFTAEQKARNFAYYEPLTTDDSSLSTPIQAIVAAEVGAADVAARCFEEAAYADLADAYGNAADGVHLASCGAVWMSLVMGFAGMRDHSGIPAFEPRLPANWTSLEFALQVAGGAIDVVLDQSAISFRRRDGADAVVHVRGREVALTTGRAVRVELSPT